MQRKTIIVGVGTGLVLLVSSILCFLINKPSLRGSVINPPWTAPKISLRDHNGHSFMEHFDPSFLDLTGSLPELQKAWQDYGVTVEDGSETHPVYLYGIDTAGNIRETSLPDTDRRRLLQILRCYYRGNRDFGFGRMRCSSPSLNITTHSAGS